LQNFGFLAVVKPAAFCVDAVRWQRRETPADGGIRLVLVLVSVCLNGNPVHVELIKQFRLGPIVFWDSILIVALYLAHLNIHEDRK
jgi:hypothetical protein